MADYLPPVVTEFTGDAAGLLATIAAAKSALADLKAQSGEVDIKASTDSATRAIGALGITATGWFTLMHLSLAVLASQIIADAAGFTAFGLAATKYIGPAAQAVNHLTTAYAALDPYQKAAALSMRSFMDSIGSPGEAGVFGVFYQGLSLVQQVLAHTGGVLGQATKAFGDFFGMLQADFGSPEWAKLAAGATGLIRQDMDALFRLINSLILAIPALVHNFNFLGLGFLGIVSGIVRAITAVAEFNPALTRIIALAGVAIGAYHLLWVGIGAGAGPLQAVAGWFKNAAVGVMAFVNTMRDAGIAEALLTLGTGTLTVGVLGLVAGLALLVHHFMSNTDANASLVQAMAQTDNATGNNIAGYRQLATQLSSTTMVVKTFGDAIGNMFRLGYLSNAQQAITNIRFNAAQLGVSLGLTSRQVIAFANATGVDLTKSMQYGSASFIIAASKIQGLAQAVNLSHHPLSQLAVDAQQASSSTNSLTQQVQALNAALNTSLGPYQNVITGTVTFRNDLVTLKGDLKASGDQVGYWNAGVRQSAQQMATAVNDAINLSGAIKQQTGSTANAIAPLQQMINFLKSTGSQSAITRHEIQLLQQAINALQNKTITITTNFVNNLSPGSAHGFGNNPGSTSVPTFAGIAAAALAGPSGAGGANIVTTAVVDNHIYIDGKEIFKVVQKQAVRRQKRTGFNGLAKVTR